MISDVNGARLWYMIAIHIRETPSSSVFQSNLKKYSLNQYKITPHCDHEFMGNSMRGHSGGV